MIIAFVILHYKDAIVTSECMDSIIHMMKVEEYRIIVVDNASQNGSLEKLKERYASCRNIDWIENCENLGFSRGNNIGYRYAKEKYDPEYILIGNNDLIFQQKDFVEILQQEWLHTKFDVAGPDIENLEGIHQNPHRESLCSIGQVKKRIRNKKILLAVLKLKKRIKPLRKIQILEKIYLQRGKRKKEVYRKERQKDVVLHGSCFIFSRSFIEREKEAFQEETFLYYEEEILALKCIKQGYARWYLPELKVLHKEGASTEVTVEDELDRNIFVFSEQLKAEQKFLSLLVKHMKM